MQKFTRALTREIVVGEERLAVTLSEEGLSFRVVGSRKPPYDMTWTACLCACTQGREHEPGADETAAALKALRAGGKERPAGDTAKAETAPPVPEPSAAHGHPSGQPHEHPPVHSPQPLEQPGAERTTKKPAAKGAGRLPALLGKLDAWLHQHRARFAKGLLPGATPDQLAALESALGQPLPDELRSWLAWHNGQSPDVAGAFVQSFHLLSAEQIANVKKELDARPSPDWDSGWIPFLDDDNDNYVCLDTRQPGIPVRECWRGKGQHAVVAESLTAWGEQFLAALEKGAYVEDPERGDFYPKE